MAKPFSEESAEISGANIIKVTVGTNTPRGGDAGHGGKTSIKLESNNTSWKIKVKSTDGKTYQSDNPEEIMLELYGDSEASTIINALKFAVATLERQIKN